MNKKTNKSKHRLLYLIMPLIAITALGVSSFLWYTALVPETERITIVPALGVSPGAFSAGLEGNLRLVLSESGIEGKALKVRDADTDNDDGIRKIYSVSVPSNMSLTMLNFKITKMSDEMGGRVFRGMERKGKSLSLTLGSGKTSTDIIILSKVSKPAVKKSRMAIVIDDLGIKNIDLAKRLCGLKQVVTLAILPFQRRTDDVIDLAEETNTPYILHMPMEPKSANANPGKGALFVSDDESAVRKKLAKAFGSVSKAQGVNNHMGSKITENARSMEYMMTYLRENNHFFLDSQTSRESAGHKTAQKKGVKSAKLTGFIDASDDIDKINQRLTDLTRYALENGSAIIIGHDRPNTVEALEKRLSEIEAQGIEFVPLTDLIR